MKKIISLTIALALLLCAASLPALAAGKMTVAQENFHVTDGYSVYGYALAKVENTGDKPVEFSAGLLEIYDEAGRLSIRANPYRHTSTPEYAPHNSYKTGMKPA